MSILHGDNRFYNNIFVQNWPVTPGEAKVDMGFTMVNNQEVGTAEFNGYPTYEEWIEKYEVDQPANFFKLAEYHFDRLPVWAAGNVYFNGAKAWEKETDNLIDTENKINVELVEEKDTYKLKTNIYEFLKDYENGIITTELLGKAFETDEYFENPDGTAIIFNEDFLGEHRGSSTIPGPFASAKIAEGVIW